MLNIYIFEVNEVKRMKLIELENHIKKLFVGDEIMN